MLFPRREPEEGQLLARHLLVDWLEDKGWIPIEGASSPAHSTPTTH